MIKKTLSKIVGDEDLKASCFNFTAFYGAGVIANIASNYLFDFNLNMYRSVEHLALGAAWGTLSYRKAGGGFKGIVAGLATATLFNAVWEFSEPSISNYNGESFWDVLSDVAMVYAGASLSFFGEEGKKKLKDELK